ncbi:unnamed protein product [Hymenolepis diminuta]|uniref:Uncharacterized protein n=1 Tax=Hymenolepis diminuta TaxID=6216 RepID=A0A564YQ33_HYMDI|nr:unnamed protein product [Hymenolepis diminuta]
MAFVPYLSLTRLNPHCGLINTFWSKQVLVFCSKTGVSCVPLVVILTPTILRVTIELSEKVLGCITWIN